MISKKEISAYYDGMREGISLYAHWKDGIQYVGSTGMTLSEALDRVNQLKESALLRRERKKKTELTL